MVCLFALFFEIISLSLWRSSSVNSTMYLTAMISSLILILQWLYYITYFHVDVALDVHFINTLPVAAAPWWVASFPRRRESRRRAPWGLDARLRGHDVLLVMTLVPDLRNGHLVLTRCGLPLPVYF